jgi:hypothetical protein
MAIVSITDLKAKFENGDYPRQADYEDLIDTLNAAAFGGSLEDYIEVIEKGQPNGVAELDENGFVPSTQLDIVNKVPISATAPTITEQGALWYNSSDGSLYVYFEEFWVEVI